MASLGSRSKVLADLEFDVWAGWQVPRNTPEPVVLKLSKAVNDALHQPEIVDWLRSTGADVSLVVPLAELDRFFFAST